MLLKNGQQVLARPFEHRRADATCLLLLEKNDTLKVDSVPPSHTLGSKMKITKLGRSTRRPPAASEPIPVRANDAKKTEDNPAAGLIVLLALYLMYKFMTQTEE